MDNTEVFAHVAELRTATAGFVESLDEQQLATPSLCGAWDVRTVAAHLTVLVTVSAPSFALAMLRSRGNFDRANDLISRRQARRPVPELAAILRAKAGSTATPPVGGPRAPLTDLLVHNGDMRIPLGLPPVDAAAPALDAALDFLSGKAIGFMPKGRLDGIALAPTDLDRRFGSGAELSGAAQDLIMGVAGRSVVLDRLAGPGKDILAGRLRH